MPLTVELSYPGTESNARSLMEDASVTKQTCVQLRC